MYTKGGHVNVIEKIILAIAITFSLYGSIQIKPQPRVVSIGMESHLEIRQEQQAPILFVMV
jgi:hypothetical protein